MSDRPFTQRLFDWAGVPPLWVGLLLFVAQLTACWAWSAVFGAPEAGVTKGREVLGPVNVIFALLIAYAPTATAYSRAAARRSIAELRPVLDCSDAEFEALSRRALGFDMSLLRLVGICFAIGSAAVVLLDSSATLLSPAQAAWVLWENLAAMWLGARTVAHEVHMSRSFSRLAANHARVTLLDLRPLAPLGHRGLQGALVAILEVSIFSLLAVVGTASRFNPPLQLATVAVALVALWMPLEGVHRRIQAAKRSKLADLACEIESTEARLAVVQEGEAAAEGARLSGLVSLRAAVEAVREWPIDFSTLGRFALYVLLGLGSWLGGAIVERIVDLALS